MGKWKTLFDEGLPPFEDREYGEIYEFGPPATAEQIASAEQALGVRFPDDLREMLTEFNGIQYTTKSDRTRGYEPTQRYLDTEEMSVSVPRYFRTCGNPLPPQEVLSKIVFVAHVNGFGELYGLCLEDVEGHRRGEVIKIDHEVGELEAYYASLADLVRYNSVEDEE